MRNLFVGIRDKGAWIFVKLRAQIGKAVCVGCDQRKLFCGSPVRAVGDKTGTVRTPEDLGMFLVSLAFYGNLAVDINIAAVFQIRLPVKGKLDPFSGFLFGQNQVVSVIEKIVSTIRGHGHSLFI